MKILFKKLIFFAILVATLYGLSAYIILHSPSVTEPTFYNMKNRLLQQVPSPKIIVVGGSSVLFGIDSTILEKNTAIPVVNLGGTADYGLKFMLEEVRRYSNQGDIVILSPEYELMNNKNQYYGGNEVIMIATKNIEASKNITDLQQKLYLFTKIPALLFPRFFFASDPSNLPITDKGNLDWDRASSRKNLKLNQFTASNLPLNKFILSELIEFREHMGSRGVKLVITPPYIPETAYLKHKTSLDRVYRQLASAGFTLLSTPNAAVLSEQLFFDTMYHPNVVGRMIRSENTSRDLQNSMKN